MNGAFFDVLKLVQNELNFTYELVPYLATSYGEYNESIGEWTGVIGELKRNEINFTVTDMSILLDRAQVAYS